MWEPSSVNIASVTVTSDLPIIEISERRKISAMSVKNNNVIPPPAESSHDLMPYDDAAFLIRIIGNVRVATKVRVASISFLGSKDQHLRVNAETVARKSGVELTTTQRGVRYANHPLHRRYWVDHLLELAPTETRRYFLYGYVSSKVKSLNGMEYVQLITNGSFTRVYPMGSKSSDNIAQELTEFIDDMGIPGTLICNFATEQTGKNTEVMKVVLRIRFD